VKLLYFAWVRERIGVHEEDYALPVGVSTVGDLIAHLAARGDGYARAFADPMQIRAAVNQETAQPGNPVADGDEIAFFPPMTGGNRSALRRMARLERSASVIGKTDADAK
jgi:molybdopterin synthase sulfur carrier subunit